MGFSINSPLTVAVKLGKLQPAEQQANKKTNYFWSSRRDLPKINLADFERDYFDTRIEKYF